MYKKWTGIALLTALVTIVSAGISARAAEAVTCTYGAGWTYNHTTCSIVRSLPSVVRMHLDYNVNFKATPLAPRPNILITAWGSGECTGGGSGGKDKDSGGKDSGSGKDSGKQSLNFNGWEGVNLAFAAGKDKDKDSGSKDKDSGSKDKDSGSKDKDTDGVIDCTTDVKIIIEKLSGGTNCGYTIYRDQNTRLVIDTSAINNATDCEMYIEVHVPKTLHIAEANGDFGLVSRKAWSRVQGMIASVRTISTTGSTFLDITSADVKMQSDTGDQWADGLTQYGLFQSLGGGDIRVRYCRAPQDIAAQSLNFAVNPNGALPPGDVSLIFPPGTNYKFTAAVDPAKFKQLATGNCPSCSFAVQGNANNWFYLTNSSATNDNNICKYN